MADLTLDQANSNLDKGGLSGPALAAARSVLASKYAAAPTATPTPSPTGGATTPAPTTGGTLVDRYAGQKQQLDDVYDLTAPDPAALNEQYRQQAQGAVDAITTKFGAIEARDRNTIDQMNREQRAGNVMSGLSGSNVGAARTIATDKKGADMITGDENQKQSEINAVLDNADTRSTEEFQNEKTAFLAQQKDELTAEQALGDKIATTAKSEIGTLASGMSYDDFATKNPGLVKQYMSELGTDENGLKAIFLQNSQGSLLSPTPQIVGDKAIWFTQGADGSIKQTSVDIPSNGKEIADSRITDNGIQVLYKDGTYAVLGGGVGGGGGTDTFTKTQLATGAANAGVPMDQFGNLTDDDKNYFIHGYSTFNTNLKAVKDGTATEADLRANIDASPLSDDAKNILYKRAGISSTSPASASGPGFWKNALDFAGSLFTG